MSRWRSPQNLSHLRSSLEPFLSDGSTVLSVNELGKSTPVHKEDAFRMFTPHFCQRLTEAAGSLSKVNASRVVGIVNRKRLEALRKKAADLRRVVGTGHRRPLSLILSLGLLGLPEEKGIAEPSAEVEVGKDGAVLHG